MNPTVTLPGSMISMGIKLNSGNRRLQSPKRFTGKPEWLSLSALLSVTMSHDSVARLTGTRAPIRIRLRMSFAGRGRRLRACACRFRAVRTAHAAAQVQDVRFRATPSGLVTELCRQTFSKYRYSVKALQV